MPAVTLGFAEIEQRLQTVRRRVNLFDAQHVAYVALSAAALAVTALIVAALRAPASTFSAVSLGVLVTLIAVPIVSVWLANRRWRNVQQVAALVDERAQLQDRMMTLLYARAQQPTPRLASLLLADAFALRDRWQPQVVAPRRVPRSLYLLLATLAALASTAFIPRQDPPPAAVTMSGGGGSPASSAGHPGTGAKLVAQAARSEPSTEQGESSSEAPPADGADLGSSSGQDASGKQNTLGDGAAARADAGRGSAKLPGGAIARELQQLIRQAFHAEAMGEPQQLAQHQQGHGANGEHGNRASEGEQQRGAAAKPQSGSQPDAKNATDRQAATGASSAANARGAGSKSQPNGQQSGDENKSGGQPGAGSGSSGAGLLTTKGGQPGAAGAEPKTFTITLSSFLQGLPAKPAPQPPGKRGRVSDEGLATPSRSAASLSEQQTGDDAIRKSDIPPEFEDVVRRVFSQRPAS